MKKWIISLTTIIMVIILGVIIGVFIGNKEAEESNIDKEKVLAKTNIENTNSQIASNAVIATSSNEEKTTPSTIWETKIVYNDCGHTIEEKGEIPIIYVNLTEKELKEELKNEWDIKNFSKENVSLFKYQHGICKEHYVLKEKDGYIAIYTLDKYGNEHLSEITDISVQYLPELDLQNLKEGIKVIGKEALNEAIEDYE